MSEVLTKNIPLTIDNKGRLHVTKSVENDLKEFGSYKARVIQEILQLESDPLAGHALRGKLKGLQFQRMCVKLCISKMEMCFF